MKTLVCKAYDIENDGIWSEDCGQDFDKVNATFKEWEGYTTTLSKMWLESSTGKKLKNEAEARAWLAGEELNPNYRAEARARKSRTEAAENRNKSGNLFTPEKADDWIRSFPLQGRELVKKDLDELYKLKKALRAERPESLIYWGKIQQTLTNIGCPYTGKAGKREAFNDFCEYMEEIDG